jgi:phage-related protein
VDGLESKGPACLSRCGADTFGFALYLAQLGEKHSQAKPLKGFGGAGVVEDDDGGTYRAVYTVSFARSRSGASLRRRPIWI